MPDNCLTVLGSSSGLPQADRACSGYLLKTGESLTLLDCGGGVTSSFLRRGYNPLDVDRVFITHTHSDHVAELPLFIQLIYLRGRRDPFHVYLPSEFVTPFKSYLQAVYLMRQKLPFELNIVGYKEGLVYDAEFKLTAIANKHLDHYAELVDKLGLANRMQCFSFEVEVGGKSIFYSSDVGSFDDVRGHLDGRDIVIIESTHIDLDQFFQQVQKPGAGRIVVSHLGGSDEVAKINQMARKAGIDNIVTAVDGMEFEF